MTAEELINLALDADKIEDFQTAFNYYKQAAELKNPSAMAMLAGMYELGIGVESDIHEALKWYVDAANAGEVHAQQRLETFFLGLGKS